MHTITTKIGDVDGVEEGFRPIIDRGFFFELFGHRYKDVLAPSFGLPF